MVEQRACSFRRALLLYNPVSGAGIGRRVQVIERVAEVLARAGVHVTTEATRGQATASEQARAAIRQGFDAIIACGGDGTVHDVLQGMVGEQAVMGVVPLGTGNILARDLELSRRPEIAAQQLLRFQPEHIPVGKIRTEAGVERYFTVAAGVGAHAEMIYRAGAVAKQHGGQAAYYAAGLDLLLRHRFLPFQVEITREGGEVVQTTAFEVLVMRVRSFGGVLRRWRPGSSLESPQLCSMMLMGRNRLAQIRYVIGALTGASGVSELGDPNATVAMVSGQRLVCKPEGAAREIRIQVDGESVGTGGAELSVVQNGVRLLMPVRE